jgi:preprotein translocase subunit SecG
MLIAIYILTFFLVLNCLFLGLLILMQLPKKEAGLGGAAFGGGAVDALIGAGAGNVLTKATKWSSVVFFVLIVSLSLLHSNYARRNVTAVSRAISQNKEATVPPKQTAPITPSALAPLTSSTSAPSVTPPPVSNTDAKTGSTPVAPKP